MASESRDGDVADERQHYLDQALGLTNPGARERRRSKVRRGLSATGTHVSPSSRETVGGF